MLVISDWIEPTARRWGERRIVRDGHLRRLRTGNLLLADSPERLESRLRRLARQPGNLERFIGASDLLDVNYLARGEGASRSVGRIHVRTQSGQTIGYGTGFLISPRLVLTNAHVLSDPAEAGASIIEFDYEAGADGNPLPSFWLRLDPGTLWLLSDPTEFDAAVVALADPDGRLARYGWNPLIAEEGKVVIGEPLTIVQHPSGQPKQIALRENQLLDVLERHLHYRTDTAPGSSGSPVFNNEWEVVALHHMGVPRTDAAGSYLKKDGTPWHEGEDDNLVDWIANEGVRASRIAAWIKGAPSLNAGQRKLLEPVFAPRSEVTVPEISTRSAGPATDAVAVAQRGDGITLTVPLSITVRIGGSMPGPAGPLPQAPPAVPAPIARPRTGEPRPKADDNPEVQAALKAAEEAKKKPYYAETKDDTDRAKYYRDVAPGVGKKKFFAALHKLETDTHKNQPAYRPMQFVYPWVDLHPDLKIRSIYSGRTFDASELIRLDFEVDRRRAELREMFMLEAARVGRTDQEALDLLEAQLPYNCEHVVPQSWFDKDEPMRGDIHHLFACESGCNSFRGNTPYFDFADFEEKIRSQCGKKEGDKFEPASGKGPVARAVLYFLLRYPGEIDDMAREYTPERLAALVEWHKATVPSRYEKHRNAAIFEIQGNRNPLIDHPEWVDMVDFTEGLG